MIHGDAEQGLALMARGEGGTAGMADDRGVQPGLARRRDQRFGVGYGDQIPSLILSEQEDRGVSGARGVQRHPHVRGQGGGWEELTHVQGVVAVRAQEGLEELFHVQGREGQR